MKYLEQKPGHFWWTKNPRYFLYFIRELSGILIAIYALYWAIGFPLIIFSGKILPATKIVVGQAINAYPVIQFIGLTGALIHTLTWLWVMPKIMPLKLTKAQQTIMFFFLLAVWMTISWILLSTLNIPGKHFLVKNFYDT